MRAEALVKVFCVHASSGQRYHVTVSWDSDGGKYEIVDREGKFVASGRSRHWSFVRAEKEAREHAFRL